jgi:hypothetical protein
VPIIEYFPILTPCKIETDTPIKTFSEIITGNEYNVLFQERELYHPENYL